MNCPVCKNLVSENAEFCGNCGHRTKIAEEVFTPYSNLQIGSRTSFTPLSPEEAARAVNAGKSNESSNNSSESINGSAANEIIDLLKRQNHLLANMNHQGEVNVSDVNMSIGSMVVFMLKWLVASIPVGCIITLVLWIISAIIGVSILSLL